MTFQDFQEEAPGHLGTHSGAATQTTVWSSRPSSTRLVTGTQTLCSGTVYKPTASRRYGKTEELPPTYWKTD